MIWFDEYNLVFNKLWEMQFGDEEKKGFLLAGEKGTGKTLFIEALRKTRYIRARRVSCKEIELQVKRDGQKAIYQYATAHTSNGRPNVWIFDDIGTERKVLDYGNEYEIIEDLIHARYEAFDFQNIPTYGTTNLSAITTPESGKTTLTTRYDDRVFDRMRKMMHFITFQNTKSLR